MRKESVNYEYKCTFNSLIIFYRKDWGGGFILCVCLEEITNIKLQVCDFEPQITTFYVQSASLFT